MQRILVIVLGSAAGLLGLAGCSQGADGTDDSGTCARSCSDHADCPRGSYCDADGCCAPGCAFDQDCDQGTCDLETHQCTTDDGGQTGDDGGPTGDDGGPTGDDGGQTGDDGGQTGDDGGPTGDDGGQTGDEECPATHDQPLGAECQCDEQCVPEYPYCFADVLTDPEATLYCTLSFASQDCTGQVCPTGYQCNDAYVAADPPQPPFCQKCLGGQHLMGETCLCDSDCDPGAPACFKDLVSAESPPAACTVLGCTFGAGDDCPGTFGCAVSIDMQTQTAVYYCKACDPGDHSLPDGAECGCNKDCAVSSICTRDSLQGSNTCVACLGGEPRGFGEECACAADCGPDYPTCLATNNYCSKLGCETDNDCPPEGHCKDVFGVFTFCEKD